MELGLQGKVAMVTGASKGIGKAIAKELAREGMPIALCAQSAEALTGVDSNWRCDNPLQRPQEVAALAVFLASTRASYSNGVLVHVDGGATRCI